MTSHVYRIIDEAATSDLPLQLDKQVGLGILPNFWLQQKRTSGSSINILLLGREGSGRSTLINTLFGTTVLPAERPRREAAGLLKYYSYDAEVQEANVKLRVTINEAVGFGEYGVSNSIASITRYVNDALTRRKAWETSIGRAAEPAPELIDFCLLCTSPNIHAGLVAEELELIAKCQSGTVVVPIITKADRYTSDELLFLKQRIASQLFAVGYKCWQPAIQIPPTHGRADFTAPFAVIAGQDGSTGEGADHDQYRCRRYPWGTINIDCGARNDLSHLQRLLISQHLEEAKRYVHDVLFNGFWHDATAPQCCASASNEPDYSFVSGDFPCQPSCELAVCESACGCIADSSDVPRYIEEAGIEPTANLGCAATPSSVEAACS